MRVIIIIEISAEPLIACEHVSVRYILVDFHFSDDFRYFFNLALLLIISPGISNSACFLSRQVHEIDPKIVYICTVLRIDGLDHLRPD